MLCNSSSASERKDPGEAVARATAGLWSFYFMPTGGWMVFRLFQKLTIIIISLLFLF